MKIITTLLLLLAPVAVVATKELPIATVHAFLKEDFDEDQIISFTFGTRF